MGDHAWNFVGHRVGCDALDLIKTIVDEYGGLSREELAATICELLGWRRATGHQYDIQERSTRLGAELPYGVSEEQFAQLTGVTASPHFIHETLNAVGTAATGGRVLPDADEIARRIDTARGDSPRRPVLVVACDEAHAPTRPPGGRKKKLGRARGAKRTASGSICWAVTIA